MLGIAVLVGVLLVEYPILDSYPREEVTKLVRILTTVADATSLPREVLLSIAMTESSMRHIHSWRGPDDGDLGVLQISTNTAWSAGCRVWRLVEGDEAETVACAVSIFREKRELCSTTATTEWWTCWHSSTSHLRESYSKRVHYHLTKISRKAP